MHVTKPEMMPLATGGGGSLNKATTEKYPKVNDCNGALGDHKLIMDPFLSHSDG